MGGSAAAQGEVLGSVRVLLVEDERVSAMTVEGQLADGSLERPVRLAALQARTLHSLRSSEARLRAIVNAEPECVKLLDAEANLIDMNPAGLRMIEADDLEVVRGRCVLDLVVAEHREAFRGLTRRAAAG